MSTWKLYESSQEPIENTPEALKEALRTADALATLNVQGFSVERINLLEEPREFLGEAQVAQILETEGDTGFPVLMHEGKILKQGAYPCAEEWAEWFGLPLEHFQHEYTEADVELWYQLTHGAGSCGGGCATCSGCGCHEEDED